MPPTPAGGGVPCCVAELRAAESQSLKYLGHRCLYVCSLSQPKLTGCPVDPGITPRGGVAPRAGGHVLYYGYGHDYWKIHVHVRFVCRRFLIGQDAWECLV